MNILMDIVALQAYDSRHRGIGRYTHNLVKETIVKLSKNSVHLALNSLYEEFDEEIFLEFQEIQSENIYKYHLINLENYELSKRLKYNPLNSTLIKKQIEQLSHIDIVHFHSIFEGASSKVDIIDSFISCNKKTVVTLYDLIPLIFQEKYLTTPSLRKWYFQKLRLLYEADLILAISQASKDDAINLLGIPENKIVNISGAIDNQKFFKLDEEILSKNISILKKYHIFQPFIMYTGGIDFRKNISKSIEAFAKLPKELKDHYQYVIVCKISDIELLQFQELITNLNIQKNKIIFTGFVTDEDLNYLYNNCKLFIFPSIYEGFGLPILEAMSCGAVVIGANSSSIPEIIQQEECLFNPEDSQDIADTITKILTNELFYKQLKDYFYELSKTFSWEKSAQKTIDSYIKLASQKQEVSEKAKIAFFSPLSFEKSDIANYSRELLPFLSKYIDIDIYTDGEIIDSDYLTSNYTIRNYREFEFYSDRYDEIIYQFGNSQSSNFIDEIALNYCGIVIVYDSFPTQKILNNAKKIVLHLGLLDEMNEIEINLRNDYIVILENICKTQIKKEIIAKEYAKIIKEYKKTHDTSIIKSISQIIVDNDIAETITNQEYHVIAKIINSWMV